MFWIVEILFSSLLGSLYSNVALCIVAPGGEFGTEKRYLFDEGSQEQFAHVVRAVCCGVCCGIQ